MGSPWGAVLPGSRLPPPQEWHDPPPPFSSPARPRVGPSPLELVFPKEVPVFEKYDEFVPEELVRKGFALGVLDVESMKKRVKDWKRFV